MIKISRIRISNGAGLPEEIIIEMLLMLPGMSLVRFRCVCKSWNNLFKTTNFRELQFDYALKNRNDGILIEYDRKICYVDYDHDSLSLDLSTSLYKKLVHIAYPLEYEKEEILGCCKGLVCYRSSSKDIIIWNPFTNDCKKIPAPPTLRCEQDSYGFGYDLKTEDYILMVHMHASLYSLKVNSWKTIADAPYVMPSRNLVFLKGFSHWLGHTGLKDIGCFDIANETLKHIPLPQHFRHKFNEAQVCVLGGWLCVVGNDFEKNISEVWKMKDYGVSESWTKMFNIGEMKHSGLRHLDLKQPFKNDAILVHHANNSTYLYDLNHGVAKKVKIDRILPAPWSKTWDFIGSLVRIN